MNCLHFLHFLNFLFDFFRDFRSEFVSLVDVSAPVATTSAPCRSCASIGTGSSPTLVPDQTTVLHASIWPSTPHVTTIGMRFVVVVDFVVAENVVGMMRRVRGWLCDGSCCSLGRRKFGD